MRQIQILPLMLRTALQPCCGVSFRDELTARLPLKRATQFPSPKSNVARQTGLAISV